MQDIESEFVLRPFGQPDADQDWDLLHRLSNVQVPQDPEGNAEWLRNRRAYDEAAGRRRHYVAVHRSTREGVGYACLEQQGADRDAFRLYIVFDPKRWTFTGLGEFLYRQLLRDARAMTATSLTMIEYANDL